MTLSSQKPSSPEPKNSSSSVYSSAVLQGCKFNNSSPGQVEVSESCPWAPSIPLLQSLSEDDLSRQSLLLTAEDGESTTSHNKELKQFALSGNTSNDSLKASQKTAAEISLWSYHVVYFVALLLPPDVGLPWKEEVLQFSRCMLHCHDRSRRYVNWALFSSSCLVTINVVKDALLDLASLFRGKPLE